MLCTNTFFLSFSQCNFAGMAQLRRFILGPKATYVLALSLSPSADPRPTNRSYQLAFGTSKVDAYYLHLSHTNASPWLTGPVLPTDAKSVSCALEAKSISVTQQLGLSDNKESLVLVLFPVYQ